MSTKSPTYNPTPLQVVLVYYISIKLFNMYAQGKGHDTNRWYVPINWVETMSIGGWNHKRLPSFHFEPWAQQDLDTAKDNDTIVNEYNAPLPWLILALTCHPTMADQVRSESKSEYPPPNLQELTDPIVDLILAKSN
jgi:hypothetical protein